ALYNKYPKNGKQYKTNLFKNGFGMEHIPSQFKFNETTPPDKSENIKILFFLVFRIFIFSPHFVFLKKL
ncbi:hypothetical protein, partial [Mycoplasmopsis bovis]|uniref:hypothetical protein n=1 Tax=Mycoplasmopsis bovis TaxID=28903 RepID=UPI003D296EA3